MTSRIADILIENMKLSPGDQLMLRTELARLENAERGNSESAPLRGGAASGVAVGNLELGYTTGIRLSNPLTGKPTIQLDEDGDAFFGANLTESSGLSLAIFSNEQAWNSEVFGAGDVLLGDNTSGNANLQWDRSTGRLNFRGGGTTNAYISATGFLFATGATISGTLTATAGVIGGWTIGATSLTAGAGANTVGLDSGGVNPALYAGSATPGSAPFRVTKTGDLTATNGSILGSLYVGSAVPRILIDGASKLIQSTNYTSGIAGFNLDGVTGDAEFGNLRARGAIYSALFVKGLIEANAGTLMVTKSAGVLASDMVIPGAGTWTMVIKDPPGGAAFLFANSDICRCKSETALGVTDTWYTVSARVDNGDGTQSYTCTYASGSQNVTVPKGAPVLDYGVSGDGFISLSADGTVGAAVNLTMATHAGAPYTTETPRLRIGNLNGYLGYVADIYGVGIGTSAGSESNITIDATNGIRLRQGTTERVGLSAAGVLAIKDSGGNAVFTFDASAGAEFTKPLTIGTSGGVYQGTGTFASPTTGLKIWNDSGVGRLATYSGGNVQVALDTTGRLLAGAGAVILDVNGIQFYGTGTAGTTRQMRFRYNDSGTERTLGRVYGDYGAGDNVTWVIADRYTGDPWSVCSVILNANDNLGGNDIRFSLRSNGAAKLDNTTTFEIEGDVYTTAWTDYSASSSIVGWTTYENAKKIFYKKLGKLVFVQFYIDGTSNSTSTTFTLPVAMNGSVGINFMCRVKDNGSWGTNPGLLAMSPSGTTVTLYKDMSAAAWTASGEKGIYGEFFYEGA